jgi:hypothetical protein
MTEPTLSPVTHASVQGLVRAKADLEQWTHNLEQALADDVGAARLTHDEAAEVAKTYGVDAPSVPPKEETPETDEAAHTEAEKHPSEEEPDDDDPPGARRSKPKRSGR